MDTYLALYEFAASAGAFEGYVYHKDKVDLRYLPNWITHLRKAYELLPADVKGSIQPALDKTLGRAIRSLSPLLPEGHNLLMDLRSMVKGELPSSPDDFEKKKWFE